MCGSYRFSTLVTSQIHLRSILGHCFICVLVSVLKSLPASPLATATFSTVHFSMSKTESSRLVASSVSLAQVKKEISAAFTDFSVFSASSAGSVSLTGSGVSFIDIHCFFRSVTNLNSCSGFRSPLPPLSLLGPAPLLGPWWPLPTASGVLFLDILSSIPSGPETKCWSPPPSLRQEGMGVCPSSKSLRKHRCLPPGSSCESENACLLHKPG